MGRRSGLEFTALHPESSTLVRQIGKKGRLTELVVTGQKKGVVDRLEQDVQIF